MSGEARRAAYVRVGVGIEVFSVLWMVIEAAISLGAGIAAGSALLTAFGLDSVVELVSAGVLLWRLSLEAREGDTRRVERAEHRAAWIVGIALALLSVYVLVTSGYGLLARAKPASSLIGLLVSAAAVLVMPGLAFTKRRIAGRIPSAALRALLHQKSYPMVRKYRLRSLLERLTRAIVHGSLHLAIALHRFAEGGLGSCAYLGLWVRICNG